MRAATWIGLVGAAAVAAVPVDAWACGGFFCSRQPIDQTAERIVFVMGETPERLPTVEAHVQVSYTGSAESFAWVVPMPARPTIGLSSPQLFTWVEQSTQPQFNLQYDAGCMFRGPVFAVDDAVAGGAPETDGGSPRGVTVVSVQDVGPYTAATLQATDATALTTWLRDNEYDVTDQGAAALVPYLGTKYYFVALKLQRGRDTGDLKPIRLNFTSDTPCIPIKLTAIAARPDMPIIAYVFSDKRAVPTNFRHVLINEARIDWVNFGSNYRQVATAAVDEAGGRAFLTEFAGDLAPVRQSRGPVWFARLDTAALARIHDPVEFWNAVISQGFPTDGLLSLARKYIPKPPALSSIDENSFYNRIESFRSEIQNDPGRAPFDYQRFADDLQAYVVEPLAHAEEIASSDRYLTRLFTTMSPDEMTEDPEFAFNDELGDVSNLHVAHAQCDLSGENIEIRLADGRRFRSSVAAGPVTDQPAAARIEQLFSQGAPQVVQDNSELLNQLGGGGCGGCDGGASGLAGLALLGLLARRRRAA